MRQPGDGSCLFHSMSYGLGSGINASRLRSEICTFIQNNPELKISDTPLKVTLQYMIISDHFDSNFSKLLTSTSTTLIRLLHL